MPNDVTPLDRLAYVGLNGMGALVYEADENPEINDKIDLDFLASQTEQVWKADLER